MRVNQMPQLSTTATRGTAISRGGSVAAAASITSISDSTMDQNP